MDRPPVHFGQESLTKIGLVHGLAAGKRHSPARLFEEDAVPLDFLDDVFDADDAAGHFQGFVHADLDAIAAKVAFSPVDGDRPAFPGDSPARTSVDARVAARASRGADHEFLTFGDALGVMAPKTMQGAAFEKNGRPDAGAVMDREPLDIEDDTFCYLILCHSDGNISHIRHENQAIFKLDYGHA